VVLNEQELHSANGFQRLDAGLHDRLIAWAERWYRETLEPKDLADPHLLDETRGALDQLTAILNLGSDFYPFQRERNAS
jgi:succinylarginine dihydrolase